jgi:hypothetical protein
MKGNRFYWWVMAALLCAPVLAGCGPDDPKKLAQQTYDVHQQALTALFDLPRAAKLQKKLVSIQKKVLRLSDSDRAVYAQELARLTGKGLGEFMNATTDFINTFTDSFNAATGDLFNNLSVQDGDTPVTGTQGGTPAMDTQDVLKTTEQALDVAKSALDLLKVMGD